MKVKITWNYLKRNFSRPLEKTSICFQVKISSKAPNSINLVIEAKKISQLKVV